ncbi:tetratricopeptide repeat protein [Paucibacter sp. B2R-40]|uniref:tetratricopeptide repeat protein n=1 Tax=Paucibacter sp. B2R-40 TaxID=2893554 RepID=UPI0021E496C2|nr:tetratricopeptide repeat protein [Paucibacter sp. B2R-40]MCV2353049.1 tetratricopeptide repeat protein [Paucibacter sp. B2R-40]
MKLFSSVAKAGLVAASLCCSVLALATVPDYLAGRALLGKAQQTSSNQERDLVYRWLFASDDLAEIERRTRFALETASKHLMLPADLQAAGRLALEQRKFERALSAFAQALSHPKAQPKDKAAALMGLSQVALQQRDYEGALKKAQASVKLKPTADGLMAQADALIRLGRTAEAIAAAERAVALEPQHEMAHYLLGNGYARKNYSELAAQQPAAFAQAQQLTRQASDAFVAGDFKRAAALSEQALRLLPGYGRAHAVLAKALESQRLTFDVHRAEAEARFAATPMPVVPGIERYVLNWAELSPRHQKRVALSIAPWKAYVPVLVEGGATHFIKPLYMRLSETPGAQALKDQRIGYDSRLWDDVRGAGGYNTVTGIEDVERSIFDRYNTVLHELTHQVHGVMTGEQTREIQALYRRAKLRDDATKNGFLSRYAGGSVWEYFAEGANSLETPRRDTFDNREIVRERLVEIDPELQALVARFLSQQDVSASLPIALVNAGNQRLEEGDAAKALALYARAAQAAPQDAVVLTAQLSALSMSGAEPAAVLAQAAQAQEAQPRSGPLRVAAADALWHAGQSLAAVTDTLAASRTGLATDEDRYLLDLALGDHYRKLGDGPRALAAFDAALQYQSDSPEGLWGRAAALAMLDERWDEAFAVYEQALRLRTGVVALRADLVQDLLRAGRFDAAAKQLTEALLLDADDPRLAALGAWLTLEGKKDAEAALPKAGAALEKAPWNDLALIVKAAALKSLGRLEESRQVLAPLRERMASGAPPQWLYLADKSSWVSLHELPNVERGLLRRWLGSVGQ